MTAQYILVNNFFKNSKITVVISSCQEQSKENANLVYVFRAFRSKKKDSTWGGPRFKLMTLHLICFWEIKEYLTLAFKKLI